MKIVREQFIRAHSSQGILTFFCSHDMSIYLAPKRSFETIISKNSSFHNEGRFWTIFLCIIECDKPQGTFYKGLQAFPIVALEHIGAFF